MKRILAVSLVWGSLTAAAEPPDTFRILALATRYEIGAGAEIRIVSDRIVEGAGTSEHRFALSHGSDAGRAVALDRASGSTLSSAPTGDGLRISLGTTLRARAERRLRIEEAADRAHYLRPHADGLIFEHAVPPGRITVVLPPGTVLGSSTLPVQTAVEDGRLKVGILNPGPELLPVRLEFEPGDPGAVRLIEGDFRAEDEKNIIYWLEDPAEHRLRLALELLLDTPGQAQVFLGVDSHRRDPRPRDPRRGPRGRAADPNRVCRGGRRDPPCPGAPPRRCEGPGGRSGLPGSRGRERARPALPDRDQSGS